MLARSVPAVLVLAAAGLASAGAPDRSAREGDWRVGGADRARASPGTYAWPVHGPVIRPFEEPLGPFGSGHRGIDIAAPAGTVVRSAEAGRVAFAGRVAGSLHVTIDHGGGIRTTSSWLGSAAVRGGDPVARGSPVGAVGGGHPGVETAHLHFGARIGGAYVDPLLLLERRSVAGLIRLAPVDEPP